MAKIVVTLDEWGQHGASEGSPRKEGWLPPRGGFCPEINSLAGELQPLSGILMLASVAEHASCPLGMRAKTRRNGALGISLIFLIFSPAADLSWSQARATQAVGGAAATKWISLHR